MDHEARVAVIILNWNGWDDTLACLQSLADIGCCDNVWLVDNASISDRSDEMVAIFPSLRVLRWDENYGWAGGYSRALQIAISEGFEFAYLLNNDCVVTVGTLGAVVEVARSNERLAAVGSTLAYAEQPEHLQFDGDAYEPQARRVEPRTGYRLVRKVSGAAMLVRTQAVRQVGYFDERFFCYYEETEWCARVTAAGWLLAVADESLVLHRREASNSSGNAMYYMTRNRYLFQRLTGADMRLRDEAAIMYRGLRAANDARARGDLEVARALIDGTWDGILGRVGKRGPAAPHGVYLLLSRFWIFPSGFFRSLVPSVVQRAATRGLFALQAARRAR